LWQWLKDELHVRGLPLILEHLGVLVVLNAVADRLVSEFPEQVHWTKSGPVGKEKSRRQVCDAGTASVVFQIVPTIDGVSSGPTVGAVV